MPDFFWSGNYIQKLVRDTRLVSWCIFSLKLDPPCLTCYHNLDTRQVTWWIFSLKLDPPCLACYLHSILVSIDTTTHCINTLVTRSHHPVLLVFSRRWSLLPQLINTAQDKQRLLYNCCELHLHSTFAALYLDSTTAAQTALQLLLELFYYILQLHIFSYTFQLLQLL